jgi:hypothetical protein
MFLLSFDVGRFQIAVDHAALVRILQRFYVKSGGCGRNRQRTPRAAP